MALHLAVAMNSAAGATPFAIASGAPRRRGVLSVAVPRGLLTYKGARLSVVAAAAAAPDQSFDGENPPKPFLDVVVETAQDSICLFECVLAKKKVDPNTYQELVAAGKTFVTVQRQCGDGYVTSDALIHATQSVKLVSEVFFPGADLHEYNVMISGNNDDKEAYLDHLNKAFLVHYTAVAWKAYDAYGFKTSRP